MTHNRTYKIFPNFNKIILFYSKLISSFRIEEDNFIEIGEDFICPIYWNRRVLLKAKEKKEKRIFLSLMASCYRNEYENLPELGIEPRTSRMHTSALSN